MVHDGFCDLGNQNSFLVRPPWFLPLHNYCSKNLPLVQLLVPENAFPFFLSYMQHHSASLQYSHLKYVWKIYISLTCLISILFLLNLNSIKMFLTRSLIYVRRHYSVGMFCLICWAQIKRQAEVIRNGRMLSFWAGRKKGFVMIAFNFVSISVKMTLILSNTFPDHKARYCPVASVV